jgi:hypothetical protein
MDGLSIESLKKLAVPLTQFVMKSEEELSAYIMGRFSAIKHLPVRLRKKKIVLLAADTSKLLKNHPSYITWIPMSKKTDGHWTHAMAEL